MHAESPKRWWRILTIFVPFLALTGCGEGDGPTGITNVAVAPLDLPAGFCDPINFEIECEPPSIVWFGGGQTVVVDNPDPRGINQSGKVARMQKFFDQPFGGTRLDPAEIPVDFSAGEAYRIKVWSERAVPVFFKLEETNDGTLGVGVEVIHDGGSAWQELCFDFTGVTPANTIGLTIIFDNGEQGGAIGGVFSGDWTFYYDDITQVASCGATGAPAGIVPDVSLYDPTATPVIPDTVDVTVFGSESVIAELFADDTSYSPVLAVSSGVGYGANVAQVGFTGFDPGFATFYETLDFKVKGMPNFVVFVTLYEGGDPLRINLTSSGLSDALGNGWYQVSIPLSSFTGLTTATGVVFESDNTAAMQFTMLLNDIGFSGTAGDGGDGGDGGVTTAGIVSETNNDTVIAVGGFVNSADFGGNNTVANVVAASSLTNGVTAFEGTNVLEIDYQDTGGDFGGALIDIQGADISAFTTLNFSINTSQIAGFASLTVQIEPPGGPQPGNNVALSAYAPVATSGDWSSYEIPLADFPGSNLAAAGVIGFWNPIDGSDAPVYGQLYLDDVHLTAPCDGDCGGDGGNGGAGGDATVGIFSETNIDTVIALGAYVNSADFGGNNTIASPVAASSLTNGVTAFEGTDVLEIDYQNTGGDFGGALISLQGADISGATSLNFSVNVSQVPGFANLTIQIEPPGGPQPGNNVALSAYTPVATSGDWSSYEIPLADFPGSDLTAVGVIGFWNARDGGDALVYGQLYLDDIHLVVSGDGGGNGGGGTGDGGLVPDGGFETAGTAGLQPPWFIDELGGTVSVSSDNSNGGTYAARLQADASSGSPSFPILKVERVGAGTLTGGAPVTVTFDAIDVDTAGVGKVFVAEFFTERADPPGGATNEVLLGGYGLSGSWQTFTYDTFLGADADGGVSLLFKADCGANPACTMDVFIDNVSIVVN